MKVAWTPEPNRVNDSSGSLKDKVVGHVSRDLTAIETRERPVNRKEDAEMQEKPRKKRGRPKKGEERPKELTEIEKQVDRSSEESLAALNKEAAWGGKKNSSGNTHFDVTDSGLPVTALYTGADVHDSQLAIPMEQITSSRSLSDLRLTARFLPFFPAAALPKYSRSPAALRFCRLTSGKNHQKSPRSLKVRRTPRIKYCYTVMDSAYNLNPYPTL